MIVRVHRSERIAGGSHRADGIPVGVQQQPDRVGIELADVSVKGGGDGRRVADDHELADHVIGDHLAGQTVVAVVQAR